MKFRKSSVLSLEAQTTASSMDVKRPRKFKKRIGLKLYISNTLCMLFHLIFVYRVVDQILRFISYYCHQSAEFAYKKEESLENIIENSLLALSRSVVFDMPYVYCIHMSFPLLLEAYSRKWNLHNSRLFIRQEI